MKIEFVKYINTPQCKFMGLAEVLLDGKILLRYKITAGKDGKGLFPVSASYCIESVEGNTYLPAFLIDSRIIEDEIKALIMQNIKSKPKPAQASIFDDHSQSEEKVPF